MSHDTELVAVMASLALDRDHGVYPRRRQCYLRGFSDRPCDGRLVKAHLIPQNRIAQEFPHGVVIVDGRRERAHPIENPEWERVSLQALQADDRSWVWACGGPMGNAGHHGMLDASRTLRIPRDRLPAGLEEFAEELGLAWWLEREYGPRGRST